MNEKIILASASPRRKELLDQIGISYFVHPVDIDETPEHAELPLDYVCRMAFEKATTCLGETNKRLPVLAADTSVVIEDQILGKPENNEHAFAMLSHLSGKTHRVFTAVLLAEQKLYSENNNLQAVSITQVRFRKIKSSEIQAYIETGESQDKAGAYAIQGFASIFVESIEGSFSGVVGLPLFETAALLSKQGIKVFV